MCPGGWECSDGTPPDWLAAAVTHDQRGTQGTHRERRGFLTLGQGAKMRRV